MKFEKIEMPYSKLVQSAITQRTTLIKINEFRIEVKKQWEKILDDLPSDVFDDEKVVKEIKKVSRILVNLTKTPAKIL
jgi:hypothetical protein